MQGAPKGRRSLEGPWHYCSRCDRKMQLDSELEWQRGKLLCPTCIDERLLGDRSTEIDLVLSDGKEELTPSPKLREPDTGSDYDDIIIGI